MRLAIHQHEQDETCPKQTIQQPTRHHHQQQQRPRQQHRQIMTKHRMKFNWRANWEILLVFVIIVVGIVITTIVAIRSKDKHLLVIPDEPGDYGRGGLSSDLAAASVQVPPLPQTDQDTNVQELQAGSPGSELDSGGLEGGLGGTPTRKRTSKASTSPTTTTTPGQQQQQQHHHHHHRSERQRSHHQQQGLASAANRHSSPLASANLDDMANLDMTRPAVNGAAAVVAPHANSDHLELHHHYRLHQQASTTAATTGRSSMRTRASSGLPDDYDASSTEPTPSQFLRLNNGEVVTNATTPTTTTTAARANNNNKNSATGRRNAAINNHQRQQHRDKNEQLESYTDQQLNDIHTTRSSLAPAGGGSGGQLDDHASQQVTPPLSMQGPYELAPALTSQRQDQVGPPNNLHRLAHMKLVQQLNGRAEQSRSLSVPPPPTQPTMQDADDMMTSYTKLPTHSNLTEALLRDYNLATVANLNLNSNSSTTSESSDVSSDPYNMPQAPVQQRHRAHLGASSLPFAVLLNDLIRLARPSASLVSSHANLEQPANSRPQQHGILQQLSSLPGPLLALFHQGGANSQGQAELNGASHDASESSYYQKVSMSPSDMNMILSRSLRATGQLPAYPPPKGTPQNWIPPNAGGTSVLNDAESSGADFVAGNTAGFLRVGTMPTGSGGNSPPQQTLQSASNNKNQQQQQQRQDQQYQNQRPLNEVGAEQQNNPMANNLQEPNGAQAHSGPPMEILSPQQLDDSYRTFKSAGALWPSQANKDNNNNNNNQYGAQLQQQQQSGQQLLNGAGQLRGQPMGNMNQHEPSAAAPQQHMSPPIYHSRQINSEILEPNLHVPLGSFPSQMQSQQQQQERQQQMITRNMLQQQQQQMLEATARQSPFDFNVQQPDELAVKASISTISGAARQASDSVWPQMRQQQPKLTDVTQRTTMNAPQSQPIQLNAITRLRRSVLASSIAADDDETASTDDEDEELLDSRPVSIVSPDGRPMTGKVKITRTRGQYEEARSESDRGMLPPQDNLTNPTTTITPSLMTPASSQRQVNHMDLNESALHHYATHQSLASGSTVATRHPKRKGPKREQLGGGGGGGKQHLGRGKKLQRPGGRQQDRGEESPLESLDDQTAQDQRPEATIATKANKRRGQSAGQQLDTAGSGLMSRLLGTASTNDELEEDIDVDDDENGSTANERRKEEGSVNEDRSNGPSSSSSSAGDGPALDGDDVGGDVGEVSRLTGPQGEGGSPSPLSDGQAGPSDQSIGSAGSTDSNAYARRHQHQQPRSDVEFYGHPGEETRQLKYGILGSGNYEVVNGGIYPDIEESTAAVNSVANYVRKPGGVLLAGLPKLLATAGGGGGGGQHQMGGAFMPGGRLREGFMRGASVTSPDGMIAGLFPPSPQTDDGGKLLNTPLLDMLDAAHGPSGYFDPNLVAHLGSSDTSARTTHASRDLNQLDDDQTKKHPEQQGHPDDRRQGDLSAKRKRKLKFKQRKLAVALDGGVEPIEYNQLKSTAHNVKRHMTTKQKLASNKKELMTPMETFSHEADHHRIRSNADTTSTTTPEATTTPTSTTTRATGSKSQGTNQFYSYEISPSKKVTIFSDQDLDSSPSERHGLARLGQT